MRRPPIRGSFAVAVALGGLPGCGLIHIPYPKRLPHRSIRTVHVTDAATSEAIEDADVCFEASKWVNWMRPLPSWGVWPGGDQGLPLYRTVARSEPGK